MRLYMKQKAFSFKQKTSVFDENGRELYYMEGKIISLGRKMTIFDEQRNELAFIRQKVPALMPKFFIEINGEQVAMISKKFTVLKPKYVIEGMDWEIEGDFFGHDYDIVSGGKIIVGIHKKWLSWGDAFEINIDDSADVITALAVVIAIDAVLDANQASSSSVSFGSSD